MPSLRLLLAITAVLDTGADAIGLDVPDGNGLLADPDGRLDAFIALFNLRLEGLNEERMSWQSPETRLEKTIKMLVAINIDTSSCRMVGTAARRLPQSTSGSLTRRRNGHHAIL